MPAENETVSTHILKAHFKTLAQEIGPCLSIFFPTTADQWPQSVRAALKTAEEQFSELHPSKSERDEFFKPVRQIVDTEMVRDDGTKSVGIFRSLGGLWHFRLPYQVVDAAVLGNYFEVLPLVKMVSDEQEFYLLALSQKHSRLIHCTLTSSEEMSLPPSIPTNLFDFNQQDKPDHRLENRSDAGQMGKSTHPNQVVSFGTGSDNDQKDQYLRNFFNAMDLQLQSFLRERPLPLIVAGVDYELALYHSVSEYSVLVPGGVQGAPDGLKGRELHERALEVLKRYNAARVDRALGQYEKGAANRIPRSLKEIVPAAFDGRVLHLFIGEGVRQTGCFDEHTREASERDDGDDLVNMAALQTLAQGGDVYVLPPERVPGGNNVAALLRF
jgi:hypothetical protein